MEQQIKAEVRISINDGSSPREDQKGPLAGKGDDDGPRRRPLRKGPKKRTKTGCLTCRKRRIKCGEEKPICNNCKKSKRECEGYARPVIFKPLVGAFANYVPSHYINGQLQPMSTSTRVPLNARPEPESLQQRPAGSQQPFLAPRPIQLSSGDQLFYHPPEMESWGTAQLASMTPFHYPPTQMYAPGPVALQPPAASDSVSPPQEAPGQVTSNSSMPMSNDGTPENQGAYGSAHDGSWPLDSTSGISSEVKHRSEQLAQGSVLPHDYRPEQISPSTQSSTTLQSGSSVPLQYQDFHRPSRPGLLSPVSMPQVIYMDEDSDDDDYFDVDSDEEMGDQAQVQDFNHLSLIMASADRDPQRLRSFTSYLNEPNILATYRPSFGSTPLNNSKTARIFVHFLHATGPSLSIFERHPSEASPGVLGSAIPSAQQGLWTYTLPLKALEHPALLQAMLAISSLQIASLQQAPPTVSIKHYNYALRRLRKAVGLPTRRKQIGTLAAALLLGYYEVIAAEHSKWNSHLAGSTHLIREVDFAGMTRDLRAHRRRMRALRQHHTRQPPSLFGHFSHLDDPATEEDPFAEKEATIDEKLIGAITGGAVNYDEFGTVDIGHVPTPEKHFTRKDIEDFRIQCDLHWWYCKQDMIHSMISGNRLFLPYDHWSQCPPRAGVGRLDAIYGSFDHLILLLGRLTDFGARDRKRKIRAGRAAGCDWKPNPGYFKFMKRFAGGSPSSMRAGPPPPAPTNTSAPFPHGGLQGPGPPPGAGRGTGQSPSSAGDMATRQGDSPPMMYGMIPPRGPVQLPAGFSSNGHGGLGGADSSPDSGSRSSSEEADHDVSYSEAENEWESILAAFNAFSAAFGRDYMPLPADLAPAISTPFGPALQYCTTTVGVLWGFYYAGRILLHRLHPSMPPAMMIAAGVAAATTAEYAQIVGKIAAGIYYPQRYNLAAGSLSPTLGSSLTEMTVPIFFAAVQYMDAVQRGWTISTLREITRLTGWKSATTIASGCENAWVTAAQKGKGPPYQRTEAPGPRAAANEAQARAQAQHHGLSGSGVATSIVIDNDNNQERRFIPVAKSQYVKWAWGILSLEDDLLNLDLEDRAPNQH